MLGKVEGKIELLEAQAKKAASAQKNKQPPVDYSDLIDENDKKEEMLYKSFELIEALTGRNVVQPIQNTV